jgi:hypothetical protein
VQRLGTALRHVDAVMLKQDPPLTGSEYVDQQWASKLAQDPEHHGQEIQRIYTSKKMQKNSLTSNEACLAVQDNFLDHVKTQMEKVCNKPFTSSAKPLHTKIALTKLVAEQKEAKTRK